MKHRYPVRSEGGRLLGTLTTGFSLDDRKSIEINKGADGFTRVPLQVARWRTGSGSIEFYVKVGVEQEAILSDLQGFVPAAGQVEPAR